MRGKSALVHSFTSQMDYDIYVFIETWLNEDFYDGEFFDLNIYQVFRKDRDAIKTGLNKGGGVTVVVRRSLISKLICLCDGDSLLDQLCVGVSGSSNNNNNMYIFASYIPPNSSDSLYDRHVNNVLSLYESNVDKSVS